MMTKQEEVRVTGQSHAYIINSFSVELCYIGPGKRSTGDWCFEDGFITFSDLTHLYLQLLRGRVLTIATDCSHSGCWVKQCMTFLDEQGVGPCGHSARDKGILIKVIASCLPHQVPRQLALAVPGFRNEKNTGHLIIDSVQEIDDSQLIYCMDATAVICGQDSIQDKCLRLPQEKWQTAIRIHTFKRTERGKKMWDMILIKDVESRAYFDLQIQSGGHINIDDYGKVVKSGWGELPTREEYASIIQLYLDGSLT